GHLLDRLVDDEVHAVLLGDVVEDVADVGVDDVEADRLADEVRLPVVLALRGLRRLVRIRGRRAGPRLRRALRRARVGLRLFGQEFDDELAAFEARALAHRGAQGDAQAGNGFAVAQRVPDGDADDERRRHV